MMEQSRQIGKIGETVIDVKSTMKPWVDGLGDSVVVLASGLGGSLRGMLARFWREELVFGREVITQIRERLRQMPRVEPERPAWIVVEVNISGELRECNLCVATAFDRHGVHLDNVRLAVMAVAGEATRRNLRRIAAPLLGAGGGGLPPNLVVQRQLEALIRHTQQTAGLEKFTLLVREQEFEATVTAATRFMDGTLGAEKWYEAIKDQAKFKHIRIVEDLQGGYSGARLDVCEVIDAHGAYLPLTVFKIGPKLMIEQEALAAKAAQDVLREYAVGVSATYDLGDESALRMPLAGEDHSGQPAMSYLRFFKESGDPHEVAKALAQLFGRATQPMYESGGRRWSKLSEMREWMERRRHGLYWIEAATGFKRLLLSTNLPPRSGGLRVSLAYPVDATIDDPFHPDAPLTLGWDRRIEVSMAKITHGDLNPRNVVMIKTTGDGFAPRILDFDRFGEEAPLATDFARFEAGVHIKCLDRQIRDRSVEGPRELRRYEDWVTGRFTPLVDVSLIRCVAPEFTKAVFAVNAIREGYVARSVVEDRQCYWMCLSLSLLSYLRPVYDARLSNEQRLFAVFMAANIIERHVLHER